MPARVVHSARSKIEKPAGASKFSNQAADHSYHCCLRLVFAYLSNDQPAFSLKYLEPLRAIGSTYVWRDGLGKAAARRFRMNWRSSRVQVCSLAAVTGTGGSSALIQNIRFIPLCADWCFMAPRTAGVHGAGGEQRHLGVGPEPRSSRIVSEEMTSVTGKIGLTG